MNLFNDDGDGGATLSYLKAHRYLLWRRWDEGPWVCWIMLNPSTADADINDPTIRRCINFSKAWGYAGMEVVNLFALRATDPAIMKADANPIGQGNDQHILDSASGAAVVVCAWGRHGAHLGRAKNVLAMLAENDVDVTCLATNQDGSPRHPLYLRKDLVPVAYRRRW